jgi:hypothetical protein
MIGMLVGQQNGIKPPLPNAQHLLPEIGACINQQVEPFGPNGQR